MRRAKVLLLAMLPCLIKIPGIYVFKMFGGFIIQYRVAIVVRKG